MEQTAFTCGEYCEYFEQVVAGS